MPSPLQLRLGLFAALLLPWAANAQTPVWTPGLTVQLFDIQQEMERVYQLVPNQTPNLDQVRLTVDFTDGAFSSPITGDPYEDYFLLDIFGQIYIPADGDYVFSLQSDDGSLLAIDGVQIVDNDGLHGPDIKTGVATLTTGWHDLQIDAFNSAGGFALHLRWMPPGDTDFSIVPSTSLRTDDNVVRVTSPGQKLILNNGNQRPGTVLPLVGVHPAWELETIRPTDFEPQVGAMALAGTSTLYLASFRPNQADDGGFVAETRLWRVDGIDGDASATTATQVAGFGLTGSEQINETTGMEWVNGDLYIAERTGVYRMLDGDADGIFEAKELIGDAWTWDNFHQFPFCLKHRVEDGIDYLYGALSVAISLGGNSDSNRHDHNGSVFRIRIPAAGETPYPVDYVAGGFRTPNGLNFGPQGAILVSDNQGGWNPANSVTAIEPGRFYGHFNPTDVWPPPSFEPQPGRFEDQPISPKTIYLPQGEAANSPTDMVELTTGEFAGQVLVGELTAGGIRRIAMEQVDGEWQGAVFRFSQGFEAGVNRLRQADDGTIYVGGMGSNGGWAHQERTQGLQRLRQKTAPPSVFEMKTVRAIAGGLQIEFTQPVPEYQLVNAGSYVIQQWRYEATSDYGGEKLDLQNLDIASANASADRKTVTLELPQAAAGHVIYLRTGITSDYGDELWSGEMWYSMNRMPQPVSEWQDLFDGQTTTGWRRFRDTGVPEKWTVQDGALTFDPNIAGDGGGIVSVDTYDDFELELEWKVEPDGNSGIFVRVDETPFALWEGGVEMQVLDDVLNDAGQEPLHRAGAIYDLYAVPTSLANPAETWNQVRIICDGSQISFYLNGTLTAEFDTTSADYLARVAASKFNYLPDFGGIPSGHIGLQDHGNFVQYRNIRIRPLGTNTGVGTELTRIEWEEGGFGGGASPSDEDPGFSGSGFAASWDHIGSHETVSVNYQVPQDGSYTLSLRYGRGQWSGIGELPAEGTVELLIDGAQPRSIALTTTPDWSEWQTAESLVLNLSAGVHSFTLRNPYSNAADKALGVANFDYLDIEYSGELIIEPLEKPQFVISHDDLPASIPFGGSVVGEDLRVRITSQFGKVYDLRTSTDLENWQSELTLSGDGSVYEFLLPDMAGDEGPVFFSLQITAPD